MIEKEVIPNRWANLEIRRDIRHTDWGIDEDKIRAQISEIRPLWKNPMSEIDPRKKYHLDTTKVAFPRHRERVLLWQKALKENIWPPRIENRIAPITVDMALTQKCGFSCTYCYAGLQFNPASTTQWETYKNLLDDMVSIGHKEGEGVRAVSLVSDGESTESPYFYDFISYGKSRGLDLASGTNGWKLDKDKMPELLRNLTYIRFNISAAEKEAYERVMGVKGKVFDEVMENIRESVRIKKRDNLSVTIGLQMVLLPQYADQVIPLALLGKEIGVDYTIIKHCSDDEKGTLGVDYSWYKTALATDLLIAAEGLSTEEHSVQAKWSKIRTGSERKYSKCFGTPLMLQTSGTCLVAPCGSFFNNAYADYHIGNFSEQRFKDIWASEKYWQVMRHLGSDKFDPRSMCATLCLQDKVNEALFDWYELGKPIQEPNRPEPPHINFI